MCGCVGWVGCGVGGSVGCVRGCVWKCMVLCVGAFRGMLWDLGSVCGDGKCGEMLCACGGGTAWE